MLRIFKTAINTPLINQSNTCNCVYVMSRSFARRKKTDLTPREMQEMNKLWQQMENTPFGKEFSKHLESDVLGKGMDQNKIMEAVFGLKPPKQQIKEDAKKKPTDKKDDKTEKDDPTAGLDAKEADLSKIGINSDIQSSFAQEMSRMTGNDPLNFFSQMNDLQSVLQAVNANAAAREAQEQAQAQAQAATIANANPQNNAKSSPSMPEGKSSKNDEGMKRVQRELAMMRKQKSKKQDK